MNTTPKPVSRQRRNQIKYPERQRARRAVGVALARGILVKPRTCAVCPSETVEAHHADYAYPLAVQWLCKQCHVKADALRRGPVRTTKLTIRINEETLRSFAKAARLRSTTMSRLIHDYVTEFIKERRAA